ncbi:MAG: signal peptidase I [Thermoflexibacter sp.]|nr:signal peptidase I [Thermoflexibacter sp.]
MVETKDTQQNTKTEKTIKKKSALREWVDAIVFAVIAATIIRWFLIEAFTIPTPSMEKSLLVGDFLFVSKFHYGARTPQTPLQLPLTHQKIWGTELPSYLDWIQLPMFRFPGISEIKNNDVVVFNYPPEDNYPTDLKTNYIKRCIGIAGDVIEIKNRQVFVNGKEASNPPLMQSSYEIKPPKNTVINERVFKRYDITDHYATNLGSYIIQTTPATLQEFKQKETEIIKDIVQITSDKGTYSEQVFPMAEGFDWSIDNFGPLEIPKKGNKISIDKRNLAIYGKAITHYDGNKNAEIKDGKLLIDGKEVKEYTFQQNYYFMMGDNRHNSQDSRIWGFVPEDHILGKGLLVWWSIDPDGGLANIFSRVRWGRIGMLIE